MKAARNDTTILYDDVLRSPGGHSDLKTESIDAAAHRNRVELAANLPDAPASTMATDVERHIDGLADVIPSLDNTTAAQMTVSDQGLSPNVTLLLERIRGVPFEGIQTEIYHGCVTLLGAVASAAASEQIEHEVQRLSGVRSVTNRISIEEIEQ